MPREHDFKIPEGPPANYDPENPYADRLAFLEMKEYLVRRKMVEMEKVKVYSPPLVTVSIPLNECRLDHTEEDEGVLSEGRSQSHPELQGGKSSSLRWRE